MEHPFTLLVAAAFWVAVILLGISLWVNYLYIRHTRRLNGLATNLLANGLRYHLHELLKVLEKKSAVIDSPVKLFGRAACYYYGLSYDKTVALSILNAFIAGSREALARENAGLFEYPEIRVSVGDDTLTVHIGTKMYVFPLYSPEKFTPRDIAAKA